MPTVHLTLQQLQEAIESLTSEEFRDLNQLFDTRRRARLAEIVDKARRSAAKVSLAEVERIIQEAVADVRSACHGAAFCFIPPLVRLSSPMF